MTRRVRARGLLTMIILILTLLIASLNIYADTEVDTGSERTTNEERKNTKADKDHMFGNKAEKSTMKSKILDIVNNEAFTEYEVGDGVKMAEPFVIVVMTLSVALVAVILRLFFAQTALDLTFITLPVVRPMLLAKSDNATTKGNKGGSGSIFISESAIDAVMGSKSSGGGGMGGTQGRDRTVGGAILSYAGDRSIEFTVFIMFMMMFFTGILGNIVSMVFNMLYSILQGFLSMFPGL